MFEMFHVPGFINTTLSTFAQIHRYTTTKALMNNELSFYRSYLWFLLYRYDGSLAESLCSDAYCVLCCMRKNGFVSLKYSNRLDAE